MNVGREVIPPSAGGLPKGAMLPSFQFERLGSIMTQWKECWRRSQKLGFNPYSTLNTWVILAKPTYWQKEKRKTEDEMIEWHHQLNGHESEQTLGDSEGQGSLLCCSPWCHRVRHDWVTTTTLTGKGRYTGKFHFLIYTICILWIFAASIYNL